MGNEVTAIILDILNNGSPVDIINKTNRKLIPKKKNPTTPLDFRPINLLNVVYKLFSKVLVNRMKPLMHVLVTYTQGFLFYL